MFAKTLQGSLFLHRFSCKSSVPPCWDETRSDGSCFLDISVINISHGLNYPVTWTKWKTKPRARIYCHGSNNSSLVLVFLPVRGISTTSGDSSLCYEPWLKRSGQLFPTLAKPSSLWLTNTIYSTEVFHWTEEGLSAGASFIGLTNIELVENPVKFALRLFNYLVDIGDAELNVRLEEGALKLQYSIEALKTKIPSANKESIFSSSHLCYSDIIHLCVWKRAFAVLSKLFMIPPPNTSV